MIMLMLFILAPIIAKEIDEIPIREWASEQARLDDRRLLENQTQNYNEFLKKKLDVKKLQEASRVMPGLGQFYKSQNFKGALMMTGGVGGYASGVYFGLIQPNLKVALGSFAIGFVFHIVSLVDAGREKDVTNYNRNTFANMIYPEGTDTQVSLYYMAQSQKKEGNAKTYVKYLLDYLNASPRTVESYFARAELTQTYISFGNEYYSREDYANARGFYYAANYSNADKGLQECDKQLTIVNESQNLDKEATNDIQNARNALKNGKYDVLEAYYDKYKGTSSGKQYAELMQQAAIDRKIKPKSYKEANDWFNPVIFTEYLYKTQDCIGKYTQFIGSVLQVLPDEGFLLASGEHKDKITYCLYSDVYGLIDKAYVRGVAKVLGTHTYMTSMGGTSTVPLIDVIYYERVR
jgi:hypothetical protein